jgi:aqualysin 1
MSARSAATAIAICLVSFVVTPSASVQRNPKNWGLDRIDQRVLPLDGSFRYSADGTGVNIYIVDSGVLRGHIDFADARGHSRVTYVGDFCTGARRTRSNETYDDGYDGHGTHNASYAAGRASGVAKNARIFSLRAQGSDGPACGDGLNEGAMKAAVDWVTANGRKPAVVNISFAFGSTNACSEGVCVADVLTAIHHSIAAGFVYTLSGATGGSVDSHWGAQIPTEALVVAGTDSSDTPIGSGYGPLLALFAPAKGLYGASRSGVSQYTIPEAVECRRGCPPAGDSFAAPFAAGVAAAYLQRHPAATPPTVRQALLSDATLGVVQNLGGTTTPNRLLSLP